MLTVFVASCSSLLLAETTWFEALHTRSIQQSCIRACSEVPASQGVAHTSHTNRQNALHDFLRDVARFLLVFEKNGRVTPTSETLVEPSCRRQCQAHDASPWLDHLRTCTLPSDCCRCLMDGSTTLHLYWASGRSRSGHWLASCLRKGSLCRMRNLSSMSRDFFSFVESKHDSFAADRSSPAAEGFRPLRVKRAFNHPCLVTLRGCLTPCAGVSRYKSGNASAASAPCATYSPASIMSELHGGAVCVSVGILET